MTEEERLQALAAMGGLLGGGYPVAPMGYASGASNPAAGSAAEGYAGALGFNIGPRGGLVYRPWEMEAWRDTGIPMELWDANLPGGGYGGAYGGYGGGFPGAFPGGLLGRPGTGTLPSNWQGYLDWLKKQESGVEDKDNGDEEVTKKKNGEEIIEEPDNGDDEIGFSPFWDYDPEDPTQWHPPSIYSPANVDYGQGQFVLNPHDPRPPFTQWQQWEHDRIQAENARRTAAQDRLFAAARDSAEFEAAKHVGGQVPQRILPRVPMGGGPASGFTPNVTPALSARGLLAPVTTTPTVPTVTPTVVNPFVEPAIPQTIDTGGPSASDLRRQAAADQAAEDARRGLSDLPSTVAPVVTAPVVTGVEPPGSWTPDASLAAHEALFGKQYVAPGQLDLTATVPTARYSGAGLLRGL